MLGKKCSICGKRFISTNYGTDTGPLCYDCFELDLPEKAVANPRVGITDDSSAFFEITVPSIDYEEQTATPQMNTADETLADFEVQSPEETVNKPAIAPEVIAAGAGETEVSAFVPEREWQPEPEPPASEIPPMNRASQQKPDILIAWDSGDIDNVKAILSGHPETKEYLKGIPLFSILSPIFGERFASIDNRTKAAEAARILLECGAEPAVCNSFGTTPIHMLCSISDDTETIGKMVSYGADVNAENTMHDRPIHYAAVSNHLSAVRFLIENGAGIDARGSLGKTPLMIAAGEGFLEMVELLLSKGADFNAVTAFGENALFYAESARSAGCEVAELLIKAGIDINCQSKNGTCLNRALLDHKTGFAGLLVKNGALVRKERLFEAVQENQLEVIKVLHEIGADMDPPDEKNRTPLMFALERNNIIAARLLVECGADQGRLDMNAAERLAGTPVLDPRNNTADRSNSKNPIITMDMHDLAAFFRLLFGKLHTRDPYRLSSAFSAKCRKCGKKITNKSILESAGVSMYSSVNADLLECHAMHCSACGHRYAAVEIKTIRR